MMEALYSWIQNIVCYMVFVTIITNLLPAGKYEKYLRLFAGCILILLVIKPVTGGLKVEEKINAIFRSVTFENEAGELMEGIDGMEQKRLDRLMGEYEKSAAGELMRLAEAEGFEAEAVSVSIERNSGSPDFGKVKKIDMKLTDLRDAEKAEGPEAIQAEQRTEQPKDEQSEAQAEGAGEEQEEESGKKQTEGLEETQAKINGNEETGENSLKGAGENGLKEDGETSGSAEEQRGEGEPDNRIELNQIEKITVDVKEGGRTRDKKSAAAEAAANENVKAEFEGKAAQAPEVKQDGGIVKFRREVAGYYQMEEENVEIRMEDR